MAFLRRRGPEERERTRASWPGPERGSEVQLDIRGRRLGTARHGTLVLTCACGREGRIRVARLIAKHGGHARFGEVMVGLRCGACGRARIRDMRLR